MRERLDWTGGFAMVQSVHAEYCEQPFVECGDSFCVCVCVCDMLCVVFVCFGGCFICWVLFVSFGWVFSGGGGGGMWVCFF